MSTIYDYVGIVRNQIRDNGAFNAQVFRDVMDMSLSTPTVRYNSSPELIQYVNEAVLEFSRYRPLRKPYSLPLIKGQTTYALPDDWITVDKAQFQRAIHPRHIPNLVEYQLPYIEVSSPLGGQDQTMGFYWYDDGLQLELSNPPLSDITLPIAYYANHQVDITSSTIPKRWEFPMLLVACEKALRAIATDYAVKLQRYRVGGHYGLEVDNHTISVNLLAQAEEYRKRFRTEVILQPAAAMGYDDTMGDVEHANW